MGDMPQFAQSGRVACHGSRDVEGSMPQIVQGVQGEWIACHILRKVEVGGLVVLHRIW